MSESHSGVLLRKRFVTLCDALSGGVHASALWDSLEAMYQVPPRGYHSLKHIGECVAALDEYEGEVQDRAGIELALWVHDCVYDSTRKDNEERSAAVGNLFGAVLGLGEERVRFVHGLVMATQHAGKELRGDEAIIVDLDLWSLAAEWDRCVEIVQGIRKEYAWVPRAEFNAGRTMFLKSLLARPHLYYTAWARERYERKARENIERQFRAMERGEM